MDEIVGTQKKFNDLSTEEFLTLMNRNFDTFKIINNLEFVFSFVGYDEEGYLAKNYNDDESPGYVMGHTKEVCEYVGEKKKQEIIKFHIRKIETKSKLLNIEKRLSFLNAYLQFIRRAVNSNPIILYGFTQTELLDTIEYPYKGFIKYPENKNDQFHLGPFGGALLKAEGAAYSNLIEYINNLIRGNNPPSLDFNSYLKDSDPKLYEILRNNFTGSKPQRIACMLFALEEKNFLQPDWFKNQMKLHSALIQSFGDIGSRQALNQNITNLRETKVSFKKQQIRLIKAELEQELLSFAPGQPN